MPVDARTLAPSDAGVRRAVLADARMRLELAALEYGARPEPYEQARLLAAGLAFQRALVAARGASA